MNSYDRRIVENLKRKKTNNFCDENKKGLNNLNYKINDKIFALLFLIVLIILIFLLF
ncbi:MAG: hypothetical protein QXU20_00525 [Candidatus Woesearchaeota archaeon]